VNTLEDKDPALPELLGRNIYFMFRTPLKEIGVSSATALISGLPSIWVFATRGDSGTWRTRKLGEQHWHIELEQPYNCVFEIGALRGFIEAFDGYDVEIQHSTCVRRGDRFCTFETKWRE